MKKITFLILMLFSLLRAEAQLWSIEECLTLGSSVNGPINSVAAANATSRMAFIYPASQLTGIAGQNLNALYAYRESASGTMAGTPNMKIYIKEVPGINWGTEALEWSAAIGGAVLVYDSNPAPVIGNAAGWIPFNFSTPFMYSGTQNLAVIIEYTNATASAAITWRYEFQGPCINTGDNNTSKWNLNTTGTLATSLATSNYRRPVIGFDYVISCPKPLTFTTANVTTNSVDLSWTAGGTETEWEYLVIPVNDALPANGVQTMVTSLTVSDLQPGTTYKVLVRAVCGTDDKSIWATAGNITTQCISVSSFVENFDSSPTGAAFLPNCWARTGSSALTYVTTGGVAPGSAPNRLYFSASGTTPTQAYAILPAVTNLQADTHRLKFKAYATTAGKTMQVGYMTNLADTSTFVPIPVDGSDDIALPGTAAATALEFTVEPTDIPAGVNNLVFRNAPTATGITLIYIDDVVYEAIPSCTDISGLAVSDVQTESVLIEWQPNGGETEWDILWAPASVASPNDPSIAGNIIDATSASTVVEVFEAQTAYKVWVRSVCGANLGAWIGPVTFTTACGVVVPTYVQDFATFPPLCWTRASAGDPSSGPTDSAAGIWLADGFLNDGAAGAVRANLYSINRTGWLISPAIDLSGGSYAVSFDYGVTTFSGTAFSTMAADDVVSLLFSEDDGATWEELVSFTAADNVQNVVQNEMKLLESSSTSARLAFYAFDGTVDEAQDYSFYIDNFKVETAPACLKPNGVIISDIAATTVTATWDESASIPAPGYQYAVATTNVVPTVLDGTNSGTVAGGDTATVTGLTPDTTYFIWVRALCSGSDPSDWSNVKTFRTQCASVTDFIENFDSYTSTGAAVLPTCWSRTGTSVSSYVTTGGVLPGSAPNRFYMTAASPAVGYAILPPVSNLAAGTHRLKFKAYATAADKSIQVGYFTDPTDTSTFVPFDVNGTTDIMLPSTTAATALEFIVEPSDVTPDVTNIVIRNAPATGTTTLYIDDVIWEPIPSCSDVSSLSSSDVTDLTATIEWESNGSETAWDIIWGPATVTDPNDASIAGNLINTTEMSEVVTFPTAQTAYKVWVRSDCGSQKGAWIGPLAISTLCSPFVPTFLETFDTMPPSCWSRAAAGDPSSGPTGTAAGIWVADGFLNDGTTGAARVNLYSINRTGWLISPTIDLSAGNYMVTFDYGLTTFSGTAMSTMAQDDVVELLISEDNGATWESVVTYTYLDNIPNSLQSEMQVLSSVSPNARFALYAFDGTVDETPDYNFYIDNFRIATVPTCLIPTSVEVVDITNGQATVQWEASASVPTLGYQYAYSTTNAVPTVLDGTNSGAVSTGLSVILTSLSANTTYYVWVRSVCSGSDSSEWTSAQTFKTQCDEVTSFTENFDSYATGATILPTCWTRAGNSALSYVTTGGVAPGTAPNRFYMSATGTAPATAAYAIMRPVSNLSAGTHRLKFKAYATTAGKSMQVGYFDDPTDITTFVPIIVNGSEDIILPGTTAATAVEFQLQPTDIPAGVKNLVFRNAPSTTGATVLYIDDVVWELAPLCPDLTGLAVIGAGQTYVDLMWNETGSEAGFQVIWGPSTITNPDDASIQGNISTATSGEHTVDGLSPQTTYKFWVRSTCGNDYGTWSAPVTATTLCAGTTTPYGQNFESATIGSIPACTTTFNAGTGNNWTVQTVNANGFSSKVLRYNFNTTNVADAWFFTQGINLTAGETYSISYKFGNNSTTFIEKMNVMVGGSATVDGMTEEIADHSSIAGGTPQTNEVEFTASETGPHYFGFHAYSAVNQHFLYLDDIVIDSTLGNGDFDSAVLSAYPNPVNDFLNLSFARNISQVAVFNVLGQQVMTSEVNANETRLDMSALPAGTYLIRVNAEGLLKTVKVIKN